MGTTREEFIAKVIERANGYADEAEHQDGQEFWNEFDTAYEATEDFTLHMYNQSKEAHRV